MHWVRLARPLHARPIATKIISVVKIDLYEGKVVFSGYQNASYNLRVVLVDRRVSWRYDWFFEKRSPLTMAASPHQSQTQNLYHPHQRGSFLRYFTRTNKHVFHHQISTGSNCRAQRSRASNRDVSLESVTCRSRRKGALFPGLCVFLASTV